MTTITLTHYNSTTQETFLIDKILSFKTITANSGNVFTAITFINGQQVTVSETVEYIKSILNDN